MVFSKVNEAVAGAVKSFYAGTGGEPYSSFAVLTNPIDRFAIPA
jgi:hypothetical protein